MVPEPKPGPQTKIQSTLKPVDTYRWYELDYLLPYRDLVLVLGFVSFVTGCFLVPFVGVPLGFLATGAGLIYASIHIIRR